MAVNEPVWSIGTTIIGTDDEFWSYGQSRFTGEGQEAPTSVIDYDILWSAGQPAISLGSGYTPDPDWSAGQSYLLWELVEGIIFGQVELAGVVIG